VAGSHSRPVGPTPHWQRIGHYLQIDVALDEVLATFPVDPPITAAVKACRGLRLLRQDPWECLASFILSSTKQIVQIQQIIALLCERYGDRLPAPERAGPVYRFPTAAQIARATEADLRACKMGFRAPYLRATAQKVTAGEADLAGITRLSVDRARDQLLQLPGVGPKIADCVLLFAYGFPTAFPIDVWVQKALRDLYFPRRKTDARRLIRFAGRHFGPHAGYAQQYLFHYMRKVLH
jgi:N-glycosylase/DNA lyase